MARRARNDQQPRQSLCCVKFFIFLLLAGLSASSFLFYETLVELKAEIGADESTITSLQNTVKAQQKIINRFNESVTNADVQRKVAELEGQLHSTESEMLASLTKTKNQIAVLLNSTVQQLDSTVSRAQAEIQTEVNLVHDDVNKYQATTKKQFKDENNFMIWQIAGTFTVLACLISMWHMTAHVRKFNRPFVQRRILAILWMSPIYSVTSWCSLVFPKYEPYLSIVKDFYESYVVYQFIGFLISVLGKGNRDTVVNLLAKHADHLEPPMRMCGWCRARPDWNPRTLADAVLMRCQALVIQFVFLKPLTAIGLYVCIEKYNFGTGSSDYMSPVFWLRIVQNLSVFMAFNGLLKFYHAVQEDLAWCKPFPKFLCIKGIVFMTFWQSVVISFLANSSTMANNDGASSADEWATKAQNLLICLEMLGFSIGHFYCFPTEEWEEGYRQNIEKKLKTGAGDTLALGDFMADLKLVLRGSNHGVKIKKKKSKKKVSNSSEDSVATADNDFSDHEHSLDTTIDLDDVKATLRNSLAHAVTNPNNNVRDAAVRVLDQIGEEQTDAVITKDIESGLKSPTETVAGIEEKEILETTSLLATSFTPYNNDDFKSETEFSPIKSSEEGDNNSTNEENTGIEEKEITETTSLLATSFTPYNNDDFKSETEFSPIKSSEEGDNNSTNEENTALNFEPMDDDEIAMIVDERISETLDEDNEETALLGSNVDERKIFLRPSIFNLPEDDKDK